MKPVILTILISVFAISATHAQFAGGSGTIEDPYQIETVEQLQEIRNHLDRHFIQIADIDASETQQWLDGTGFLSLGTTEDPFTGTYDGGGFSITNLSINRLGMSDAGLFGVIQHVKLQNINVINVKIVNAGWRSGGLVGQTFGTSTLIENCYSSGVIEAGGRFHGGLVGRLNDGAKVINSSSSVDVSGDVSAGGLVGGVYSSHIIKSFATGDVAGVESVGGLAGSASGTIIESYATGNVTGTGRRVGGLVGWALEVIRDSYATGEVKGDLKVGGLVGLNAQTVNFSAEIESSYSIGKVIGNSMVGGFAGSNASNIINSYYNFDTSGQADGVGSGTTDGLVRLVAEQMIGVNPVYNMPSLDFENVWKLTESYPSLMWEDVEVIPFPVPLKPDLVSPADLAIILSDSVRLEWTEATPASHRDFVIEVSLDEDFSSFKNEEIVNESSLKISDLMDQTTYWWRVKAQNVSGIGPYSDAHSIYITTKYVETAGEILSGVSKFSDNLYFTSSRDDEVYGFDGIGNILWTVETGGALQSTIAVDRNGDFFVGSTDTRLYSFDKDGLPRWDRALGGTILSSPSIGDGNLVFVGISTGRFFAVSKDDGNVVWSIQTGEQILSSASVDNDGNVYFGSNDRKLYAVDNSGELLWTYETEGAVTGSPALTMGGEVVFPSEDGRLYNVDGSGNLLWSYETEGPISSSPVIRSDGVIVFGSGDGKVYAISEEGSLVWSYDSDSPVNGTAALTQDGLVVIGADDGRFLVLSQSGDLLRQLRTGGAILAPVLINQDNSIHVSSTDGYVYILENLVPENHSKQIADANQPIHPWGTFKGNNRRTGNQADIVERIDERDPVSGELPEDFELHQNFPNPFNPSTRIRYAVTEQAHVRVSIYNSLGQHVSTLVNGTRSPGWYNVTFDASGLSSGLYMYRLEANGFVETRKMMFVK